MTIDRAAVNADFVTDYVTSLKLILTTAESCTAGTIISMLCDIEGSGEFTDCGFVTYSRDAKERILQVNPSTIDEYSLTSEEVAREMAIGALKNSPANVAVASTGVAGPEPMDGIPPGVVCLAWVFRSTTDGDFVLFSRTVQFQRDREQIRKDASIFAINGVMHFHQQLLDSKAE